MFIETFEILDGILCLKCEDSLGDQPTKITRWYPICIPDEMSSADRTSIIEGGRALALFLVAISDNPYAKPAL